MLMLKSDTQKEIADTLNFIESLSKERMVAVERIELAYGAIERLTTLICDSVKDWSKARPVLPVSSVQAWNKALANVQVNYPEYSAVWADARINLSKELAFGHTCYIDNIY